VIKSFKCKETAKIFHREISKRLPPHIHKIARRKLFMLNAAESLDDIKSPPGNCLEALRGSRTGQYSIRINQQFRICFVWRGSDAYNVEIVDYH